MAVVKIGELLNAGGVDPSVLSSYVNYSAIEYNGDSQITGISGSAIAGGGGGVDPSALSSYVNYSAISTDGTSITAINGSAIGGGRDYSGITPVTVDNVAREISVSARELDVDSTMTSYVSGETQYFGVNQSSINLLAALSAWATAQGWTGM